jgi:hypothetical protein
MDAATVGSGALAEWSAESVRFTAFPMQLLEISEEFNWWVPVIGEPPATKVIRHTMIRQEEGPFERGNLRLVVQPNRIDWALLPKEPVTEGPPEPLNIGRADHILPLFRELMTKWLSVGSIPELKRLAFGAIFVQRVSSHREGYQKLQRYLPRIPLDEASSEFLYQINRRRVSKSGIPALEINRLSKWNVAAQIVTLVAVEGTTITPMVAPAHNLVRLELDISTSTEFAGALPRNTLVPLLSELMQLGEEIALHGDVP